MSEHHVRVLQLRQGEGFLNVHENPWAVEVWGMSSPQWPMVLCVDGAYVHLLSFGTRDAFDMWRDGPNLREAAAYEICGHALVPIERPTPGASPEERTDD